MELPCIARLRKPKKIRREPKFSRSLRKPKSATRHDGQGCCGTTRLRCPYTRRAGVFFYWAGFRDVSELSTYCPSSQGWNLETRTSTEARLRPVAFPLRNAVICARCARCSGAARTGLNRFSILKDGTARFTRAACALRSSALMMDCFQTSVS